MGLDGVIEAHELVKSFGRVRAVDGVTFGVRRGRDLRHTGSERSRQDYHDTDDDEAY